MKSIPVLAILNMGGAEIILILAILFIFFGAKRLPELAKGLGQGIKEFKQATSGATATMNAAIGQAGTAPVRQLAPIITEPVVVVETISLHSQS